MMQKTHAAAAKVQNEACEAPCQVPKEEWKSAVVPQVVSENTAAAGALKFGAAAAGARKSGAGASLWKI